MRCHTTVCRVYEKTSSKPGVATPSSWSRDSSPRASSPHSGTLRASCSAHEHNTVEIPSKISSKHTSSSLARALSYPPYKAPSPPHPSHVPLAAASLQLGQLVLELRDLALGSLQPLVQLRDLVANLRLRRRDFAQGLLLLLFN